MRDREIAALAVDVARWLGPGWARELDDDYAGTHVVSGPVRLYICSARTAGQVAISGSLPDTTLRVDRPHINVSLARGAKAIAKEVRRRLLPRHLAALERVLAYDAEQAHDHGARQVTLAKIAAMFPGSHVREITSAYKASDADVVIEAKGGGRGTVHASGDAAELTIELRGVPADVALRMLELLARNDTNGETA